MDLLKPDMIVGTDATQSRDEAMSRGELGLDYLMFGPRHGPLGTAEAEMAAWWAQTMEIPAVLSDPAAEPEHVETLGCEFLALSESLWTPPSDPAATLAAFARRLEASP